MYRTLKTWLILREQVSDEEDDGDTVGSVLRGFLALRKRDPVTRYFVLEIVHSIFDMLWNHHKS